MNVVRIWKLRGEEVKIFIFIVSIVVSQLASATILFPSEIPKDQCGLEYLLCHCCIIEDNFDDDDLPPYIPMRNRDALAEFRPFIERSGWTTNQFIKGLIAAANGYRCKIDKPAFRLSKVESERVTGNALWKLGEIDHPAVTNYFREQIATQSVEYIRRSGAVCSMFCYTNLEPEVLDYMRGICNRTNLYEKIVDNVTLRLLESLRTMPPELQPAATNRLAKYINYSIRHTTEAQGMQDLELVNFLPAYSNSLQRLETMRYVAATATNTWEAANATNIVRELSALPTNRLNDIRWMTGD